MRPIMLPLISALATITIVLAGCSQNTAMPETRSSSGSNLLSSTVSKVEQSEIVELKDGDIYDLTASYTQQEINGNVYTMLAYNNSIPGPTLKVPQGAEITVNLKNNTDIPTSLHSHGIRLEDRYDGVVGMGQPAIDPGQAYVYKLIFPDVGMFWYHPHIHEPYTQSRGLYGNYWVVPKDQAYWSSVHKEVPLLLNDIFVQNNRLDSFNPKVVNYALMGEFGNTMFVNGVTDYKQAFQVGEVVRFYITNASNARPYNLSIPQIKMKLVGGDNGKYERETWQSHIVLSPSERAIVEVLFDTPGTYTLQNTNPFNTYHLATFHVTDQKVDQSYTKEFQILRDNKDVVTDIDRYRRAFDKAPDKSITLTMSMAGQHMMGNGSMMNNSAMVSGDKDTIEWEDTMQMMNAMSTTDSVKWKIIDDTTKEENDHIKWNFNVGDQVKIRIYNDPKSMHPMQHPIHFHGQRFLILGTNGVKNGNLVWKDTALVPKGATVEVLVDMSNPGKWMAHCHISEHLSGGMMFPFEVR